MSRAAPTFTARGLLIALAVSAVLLARLAPLDAQHERQLALAAFDDAWQTIYDSYYDATFAGLDWAAVRERLRPRAAAAASLDQGRAVIREMLGTMKQSHFVLLAPVPGDAPGGDATPLIETRIIDGVVAVTRVEPRSAADRAGVRAGDRIVRIDGRDVDSFEPVLDGDSRAVRLAWWRAVERALSGRERSSIRLTLRDIEGRDRTADVTREVQAGELVTLGNIPPLRVRTRAVEQHTPGARRVGVIAFNVWLPAVAEPFARAVDAYRAADGIVIDLRGNPGGLADMMRGLAGHFFVEPALIGRMKMRHADLEFRANPRRSTADGRQVEPFAGPLAILVDELTGSSSECFAGGLQSLGRARVFGTPTMGQALPAATKQLPGGDVLLYAVGDFITSTGRRLEGAGVTPDVTAPGTLADLAAGRDATLDAALAWIDAVSPRR